MSGWFFSRKQNEHIVKKRQNAIATRVFFFPTGSRFKGDTSCVLVSPSAWAMLEMQFVGRGMAPGCRFLGQPGMLCCCAFVSLNQTWGSWGPITHLLCWIIPLDSLKSENLEVLVMVCHGEIPRATPIETEEKSQAWCWVPPWPMPSSWGLVA